VRAIEVVDRGGLALVRASGDARRLRVPIPADAGTAMIVDVELAEAWSAAATESELLATWDGAASDTPVGRLVDILRRHVSIDDVTLALPGDETRRQALRELREAVPRRAGELLAQRRRDSPGVRKVGGDPIVPFERLGDFVRACRVGFESRGLDYAIWGHLSDGNLHPNALVRDERETAAGIEALHEIADAAVRLGGAPLSEHGVGRDPVKQRMLRRFLGDAAIDEMRAIKRALDPPGRFAPGVLFPLASAAPGL
jgi:FAD/FMN-containing dehydrogenase